MEPETSSQEERRVTSEPVNGQELLEKLAALPVSTWNYKWEDASVRHLGPMAQDFHAAFGLGDSDKVIHMIDANGVVVVALQALYRRVRQLDARMCAIEARLGVEGEQQGRSRS
jgi:hypothetical protein